MTSQLFWDRAGSGEPLLLLHGIGSTHDDFTPLRPRLNADYRVLAPDLPGHGRSPALPGRPTISAMADAIVADLDELGVGRVHVLGNSIGARIALELAIRGRARSVVAISPSGLNTPAERLYQGALMSGNRLILRRLRPFLPALARTTLGRTALLTGLRSAPWRSSETEARALRAGFAGADAFWQMLWWGILSDVPTGLERIDCPVILAQGTADLVTAGQTPRHLAAIAQARFVPLVGRACPAVRCSGRDPRARSQCHRCCHPQGGRPSPRAGPATAVGVTASSSVPAVAVTPLRRGFSRAAQTRRRASRRRDGRLQRYRPRDRPAFRGAGPKVVVAARGEPGLRSLVTEIENGGGTAMAVVADPAVARC
jgi:pimeloyl-ACP methyl ester carboxylesterase